MDDLTRTQTLPNITYTDPDQAERILAAIQSLVHARSSINSIDEDPNDLQAMLKNIDNMIYQLAVIKEAPGCEVEPPVDENPETPIDEEPTAEEPPADNEPETPVAEEPEVEEPPVDETPTTPLPPYTIKYAPKRPAISGTFDIACISLNWKDKNGPTLAQMQTLGNSVAKTYAELSNGAVKFNITPRVVAVDYAHKSGQLDLAEQQAKNKVNAGRSKPFDKYMIVHSDVRPYSNANGDVTHLRNTLIRTGLHEMGHLKPFKLEHTGRTLPNGKYDQYGDCSSFMSSCSTSVLNAPQMWYLGWLPQKAVAQYEMTDPTVEYKLKRLNATDNSDAVKAIRIINNDKEELFLSLFNQPQNLDRMTLQTRVNGGTKRTIQLFNNKSEYKGLIFERIAVKDNVSTVRISQKPITNSVKK